MSLTQLFKLIESLPPALQAKVFAFTEGLSRHQVDGEDVIAPQIRKAEQADPSALFGIAKEQPFNLTKIRTNAWR